MESMPFNDQEEIENSLISIIVITYNSAKYILETLESIKSQTFQNIELIISDDYSSDNTIKVCAEWVSCNKNRFVKTWIVESSKNTGIGNNCNRGLEKSKGDWIKLIAGDDILLDSCIEDNLKFIKNNIDCKFLFSRYISFDSNTKEQLYSSPVEGFVISDLIESQLKMMLVKNFVSAPTVFVNRKSILDIGGYSSEYRFMEDYPTYLRLLLNGVKAYYNEKETVLYRISGESLSNFQNGATSINFRWHESYKKFFRNELSQIILKKNMYIVFIVKKIDLLLSSLLVNFSNKYLVFLFKVFRKFIHYIIKTLIYLQGIKISWRS